ncbi:DUF488 domain-containing protein [Cupriavidus gilardii]|uniref:DUF488 family protein n=1 Tax=Cupriavidus gilardii TaxID=82541 RepID=A0ABY4VTQ0_9BURK|nr:DUF488 family protein [Cupriavidus gilardii]MCT9125898.1 DUF488 family protein [Cupriavidus gilardii]QQE06739.1 DUF488 family protein [Cupriavidus sp. ISTL7]USE80358.1 DUF488 family protein [Cupriavidus gilardii]
MAVHIVRLGTPRSAGEGLRIGTVRRPPRGVPRSEYASRDYYDVWFPLLSPSAELVAEARHAQQDQDDKAWRHFERRFQAEMAEPEASRTLDLLAALSHQTDFAIGCYCEDEQRCHRSILRKLLARRGAALAQAVEPPTD